MKFKFLTLVFVAFILIISCGEEEPVAIPFDHSGQAVIDDGKIRTFLETHFYTAPQSNEAFGVIDTLENGETPMLSQVIVQDVTYDDIAYKIYLLKNTPEGVGESPLQIDSAYVNYKGNLLNNTQFDENHNYFWANLYGGVITGWSYALPNYNEGVNTSQVGQPINFEQTGKGVFILPSGLAYRDSPRLSIPSSSPLIFHIEMGMIKRNDQDRDGILSIYEDLDGDNLVSNDNTDGDERANFIDYDDDDDGLQTIYENSDPNNDGNPEDAIDTDNDGKPDFLDADDDNDGILTKDENPDPNNDGNPADAIDTDGDMIPDYLDAN